MLRRQNFLYCHADSFKDFPNFPGRFIVNNFVNGKNSWRRTTRIKNKPKNLVIADWMLDQVHAGKILQIIELLKALLEEGFPIYLWQKTEAVSLTLDSIDLLFRQKYKAKITLDAVQVITQSVASKYRIPKNELLVVDNHILETLLDDTLSLERQRTLKLSTLKNKLHYKKQIEQHCLEGPHAAMLVCDYIEIRKPLVSYDNLAEIYFPSYKVTIKIEKIDISAENLLEFLDDTHDVTRPPGILRHLSCLEFLKSIKEIIIKNNGSDNFILPYSALVRLSKAAPQLESLSIQNCSLDDGSDCKEDASFDKLLSLSLLDTVLKASSFKKLLESSKELRSLTIESVDCDDMQVPLKAGSLQKLYQIDINNEDCKLNFNRILEIAPVKSLGIGAESFYKIESQLPNLQHLEVIGTKKLSGIFFKHLSKIIPSKLKTLFFYDHISSFSGIQPITTPIEELQALGFVTDNSKDKTSLDNLFQIPGLKKIITEDDPDQNDSYLRENYEHLVKIESDEIEDMDSVVEDEKIEQKTPAPLFPVHDLNHYLNFKPNTEFEFKSNKINHSKAQNAIIQKLCQYFTLEERNIHLIPKIQNGICSALSVMFQEKYRTWNEIIDPILAWDGSRERLVQQKEVLEKSFSCITDFILRYQISNPLVSYCIGNNIPHLLNFKKPHIISNSWHSISIVPHSLNENGITWIIYDPNCNEGPKVVSEKYLPHLIQSLLGNLLSVEYLNPKDMLPIQIQISSNNQFFNDGGLLLLNQLQNQNEVIQLLSILPNITIQGLSGLLLRNTKGVPAWVVGLNNPSLCQYTFNLLQNFSIYKETGINTLRNSVENLSPQDQKKIAALLMSLQPNIPHLFILWLIDVLLNNPKSEILVKQLQTWKKNINHIESLEEFLNDITKTTSSKKTVLLELKSETSIQGMRFVLQKHYKDRPVFYVDSPEDLVCSARSLVCDEKTGKGIIQDPPGGPLYTFLKENKNPILIVNYNNFKAEDIVKFNALLDKIPSADGIPLPSNVEIIGLANTNNPDAYKGEDFYSRFGKVEVCSVPEKTLQVPPLKFIDKDQDKKPFVMELYDSQDWESLLFGSWKMKGDNLLYEEGLLDRVIKGKHTVLDICNGPWDDPKFQEMWHEALYLGYIKHEGRAYPLPNISLIKSFGFQSVLRDARLVVVEPEPNKDAKVLNPNLFHEFFNRYEINNDKKTMETIPGWIEQCAGKALHVNVTKNLTPGQWAMIADKCIDHKVTLHLHHLFEMPEKLSNKKHTSVIKSTDVDVSIQRIINKNSEKKWQIINIDECTSADLLSFIDAGFDDKNKKFQFTKTECALLDGLKNNKNIILTGSFSSELVDTLSPLLLQRLANEKTKGKLVLVSERNPFSFIKPIKHKVTVDAKAKLLDEKVKPEDRPYCQLKAEKDFKKTGIDGKPWDGMRTLTLPNFDDKKIEFLKSEEITKAFTDERINQVNAVLNVAPYVFLTGLTGVGKSTFVQKDFLSALKKEKNPGRLYQSETDFKAWAEDQKPGKKILFIDEANLSARQWSELEGLFYKPPGILINGVYHELTAEHKVIFAGNPLSYGDERTLAPLFARHGNALLFDPFPPEYLYEKILKQIFSHTPVAPYMQEVSEIFLKVYLELIKHSRTEVLISPRELEMMALWLLSEVSKQQKLLDQENVFQREFKMGLFSLSAEKEHVDKKVSRQEVLNLAKHFAFDLGKDLIPKEHRNAFYRRFQPPISLQFRPKSNVKSDFVMTKSRQPLAYVLERQLRLREWRGNENKTLNDAKRHGGLGGIILEGSPASGKSDLVLTVLEEAGYRDYRKIEEKMILASEKHKVFYRIPVSMNLPEKEALLLKAFHEGAVVWIDEINSSSMMERLLNDLTMGIYKGERPKNPGFTIIGTQNPIHMDGRRAPSAALARRLLTVSVPDYTNEEYRQILQHRGTNPRIVPQLVETFQEQLATARKEHLSPAPTLRDLIKIADAHKLPKKTKRPLESKLSGNRTTFTNSWSPHVIEDSLRPQEKVPRRR